MADPWLLVPPTVGNVPSFEQITDAAGDLRIYSGGVVIRGTMDHMPDQQLVYTFVTGIAANAQSHVPAVTGTPLAPQVAEAEESDPYPQEDVVSALEERLNRAVDLLLETRLREKATDLDTVRAVLFDLYDAEVVTKAEVRRRGQLDRAEFHEELLAYRQRALSR